MCAFSRGRRLLALVVVPMLVFLATGCTTLQRQAATDSQKNRITVLYDAFGKNPAMKKDWGYSALVEVGGKRILFDTGDNPDIFAQNVKAAGVDLKNLDFVVLSHRHGDHMGGLTHLLSVNPSVKIYAPKEPFGVYGSSLPSSFYRKAESLAFFGQHPICRSFVQFRSVETEAAAADCRIRAAAEAQHQLNHLFDRRQCVPRYSKDAVAARFVANHDHIRLTAV